MLPGKSACTGGNLFVWFELYINRDVPAALNVEDIFQISSPDSLLARPNMEMGVWSVGAGFLWSLLGWGCLVFVNLAGISRQLLPSSETVLRLCVKCCRLYCQLNSLHSPVHSHSFSCLFRGSCAQPTFFSNTLRQGQCSPAVVV